MQRNKSLVLLINKSFAKMFSNMQAHQSNVHKDAICDSCGTRQQYFAKRFLKAREQPSKDVYVCPECAEKYLVMDVTNGCYSLINKD